MAKLCLTLVTPWTVAYQDPLSVGYPRQEYWNGLSFLSPGDIPGLRIKPRSPVLQADSLLTELWGKSHKFCSWIMWFWLLFSHLIVSSSLWPHGLQHAKLSYPSLSPRVCPNSSPLIQWYHSTISSSVIPFSSFLQSFPESGSFAMSQLFASSGQSTGVSASASVLPMNIQDWSPLGWIGWISL